MKEIHTTPDYVVCMKEWSFQMQRRWRERQKEKNEEQFLDNERKRKQQYYVPVSQLNKKQVASRRKATNKRVRNHYEKKKGKNRQTLEIFNSEAGPSSSTRTTSASTPLLVKLPSYKKKGETLRKRYKSGLTKAYRRIDELELENEELERSKRKVQKRLERERSKGHRRRSTSSDDADVSANLESEIEEMENYQKSSKSYRKNAASVRSRLTKTVRGRNLLKKRLLFAECLIKDMKEAIKQTDKKVFSKLPFYLLKKYRYISELERKTGIKRPRERKVKESKLTAKHLAIKKEVNDFLKGEDNSTIVVSKKESNFVKENGEENQKRVLSDYMHNLHQKFLLENPDKSICRSSFHTMRSKYLLLADFASRRTCLCSRHQNMALKIKAMRTIGINCSKNPDVFIKEQDTNEKLKNTLETEIKDANVKFTLWKKVSDGTKLRWKEVEETVTKTDFVSTMEKQTTEFRNHTERVKIQYAEMKRLREDLPENDVMMWMDFAENFTCTSVEAVQSSYWNQSMVSLHTMVAYFPEHFNKKLQSYVAVSESLAHNATSVYTILMKMFPILKEEFPRIETVHFLTDSPTSQYRNKTIFKILADMNDDFGIKGRWNYLESGHGKGPCDGLGASVKRSADMAIRQGKCLIQGADDFFAWAKQSEESGSKIKYLYYSQGDIDNASEILKNKEAPEKVTGTFQLHAVVPINRSVVMTRNVSCYCADCLTGDRNKLSNHGWQSHNITTEEHDNTPAEEIDFTVPDERMVYDGKWVAAVYDSDWYVGVVVDEDENEVEINFLTTGGKYKNTFKWPNPKEQIWIEKSKILTVLQQEPMATGKTRRMFKIINTDEERIVEQFNRVK